MAPPAVPSFEATMASILLPLAVSAFSTMDSASVALQSFTHCWPTILMSPLSMNGFNTFIWPSRSILALLSVGEPPSR
ncbi:hypothetical protein D3C72_2040750 [compost metagenome]